MNIRKVSYGIIGGLMMAGTLSSCINSYFKNKAKEEAIQYLNGEELLKAEEFVKLQGENNHISSAEVAYWDNIILEGKAKEAYAKGQQFIRDSVNGIYYKKESYKQKLDTIVSYGLINVLKEKVSKSMSAQEFIQYRDNAPEKKGYGNEFPYETHYWDLIKTTGKQNEAYQKGLADERAKINQSETEN